VIFVFLPPTKEEVNAFTLVRLSLCLVVCLSICGILLRRENPTYRYWAPVAAPTHGFKMVLFTASCGNNFVGGIFYSIPFILYPPSALLVFQCVISPLTYTILFYYIGPNLHIYCSFYGPQAMLQRGHYVSTLFVPLSR